MHATLKMTEKLDDLLNETEEYIKCANEHIDDHELKSAYMDLARCHFDGFEKLEKCYERIVERKAATKPDGVKETVLEMAAWHKGKFDDRAAHIKRKMEQVR